MSGLSGTQSFELAERLFAIGDLAGAQQHCAASLETQPDHAGARRLSAQIQCRSGLFATYRINLDKRADRLAECLANEADFGYPPGFLRRLKAVEDGDYGAVGCGKSHIAALTDCFTRTTSPYCLIVEDDFDFLQPIETLMESLAEIRQSGLQWDMLLLSGWKVIPLTQPAAAPFLLQIFESMTTAGYIVNRAYIPKLLRCFTEAVAQLETFRSFRPRKELITLRFAIDMAWQALQRQDRWFIGNPSFGHQRASFSDNEASFQDYAKDSFYKWP